MIRFEKPTKAGFRYFKGKLNTTNLYGKADDGNVLKIDIQRIDDKENYLNNLYK